MAEREFRRNGGASLAHKPASGGAVIISEEASALRWFLLPSEAAALLRGAHLGRSSPFSPRGQAELKRVEAPAAMRAAPLVNSPAPSPPLVTPPAAGAADAAGDAAGDGAGAAATQATAGCEGAVTAEVS